MLTVILKFMQLLLSYLGNAVPEMKLETALHEKHLSVSTRHFVLYI